MNAVLKSFADISGTLHNMTSYADALTAAIRRKGDLEIDGLIFRRRTDIEIPTDHFSTGRHTMIYQMDGTGKQYRVMIEPVLETHQPREIG
jgi:hypothetical protein